MSLWLFYLFGYNNWVKFLFCGEPYLHFSIRKNRTELECISCDFRQWAAGCAVEQEDEQTTMSSTSSWNCGLCYYTDCGQHPRWWLKETGKDRLKIWIWVSSHWVSLIWTSGVCQVSALTHNITVSFTVVLYQSQLIYLVLYTVV